MTNREIGLLFLLGGVLALFGYSRTDSGQAFVASVSDAIGGAFVNRGVRNCNPGNIRRNSIRWNNSFATQAECEAAGRTWDPDFVVFYTMQDGERALGHVLLQYQKADGITTVSGVVNRYAPPTENDTSSYVDAVASYLNVAPDTVIDIGFVLPQLAQAIMTRETGYSEQPDILANAVYS